MQLLAQHYAVHQVFPAVHLQSALQFPAMQMHSISGDKKQRYLQVVLHHCAY